MSEFEAAVALLPRALRDGVSAHWQAFIEAAERAGVTPPSDRSTLEQLVRVWASSDFAARSCIRDPVMLRDFLGTGELTLHRSLDSCATRLAAVLDGVEAEAQLSLVLRRFRRCEMVRIAWRDLAGLASVEETLEELSNLADVVVEQALQKLYGWQCEHFGIPRDSAGRAQQLVVLGMGKLGGRELNFSSDIDLIFSFPHQGQTDGRRPVTNEEFFRRLGQRLIKTLQEPTAEGFVFRVDMRLRPFGDSGPLVMPFRALEDYYQTHGREWERYAMIKARIIAGDRKAGEQLLDGLRPFVYRRYLDYGAFESLRAMKAMIAREVERKGVQRNIKLGPGGIREIEFIGQAFQLIYGGREPTLRERSILRVLDYLNKSGRLPAEAVSGLRQAYVFLRQTENCLQAWADRQIHNLPEEELARLRLAFAMGCPNWKVFTEALGRHIAFVASQFDQVFATPQTKANSPEADLDFAAIWNDVVETEAAIEFLGNRGFDEPARALDTLRRLRNSFSNRSVSQQGRQRMDQLIPLVLNAVTESLESTVTLERINRLLEAIARRSVYLALLIERPLVLSQLVELCAASVWIAEHLTRYPLLLDDLLDPRTLYSPLNRTHLQEALGRELEQVPADDSEQMLDALRHFKQSNVLRVAAADVSGTMPLMVVSDHLTEIAEVILQKVLELAWADLIPRFGYPSYKIGGQSFEAGFAIVAYGKLGGIELGYGSDLDLVFLHDSTGKHQQTTGPREIDNATFFAKLTKRIIHILTAHTGAGVLYEVDTRLRPSGRSGLLVSSINAFAAYQREQAWTWEHQALVRARVVAGAPRLVKLFNELRREVLGRSRNTETLRQEVRDMRERMRTELGSSEPGWFDIKQDHGGIADIEFMVQYEVLANAQRYSELLTYTDNIRQLDGLEQAGVLTSDDASFLRDAYRTLRRRSHLLKLQEQSSLILEQELPDCRENVIRIWRELMENEGGVSAAAD